MCRRTVCRLSRPSKLDSGPVFDRRTSCPSIKFALSHRTTAQNVPVFSVRTLHDFSDVDIVDRVAIRIEFHSGAESRARKVGLQHGFNKGAAVVDLPPIF